MSRYRVLWSDSARCDLEEIVAFVAAENAKSALAILDRLERRCAALTRLPERGRIVPELKAVDIFVYRELIEGPWRIIYRHGKARVHVLAVVDSRRNLSSLLLERLAR
jgi:plasmid stabilization system protein ParE